MPGNPWPNLAGLPHGASAALAALHFRSPNLEDLARLTDAEWRDALDFTDRSQLTLPLCASPARDAMPPWAQERTDASAARNLERLHRVEALYRALDAQLRAAGIDYLALKGLTHCPEFCATAAGRVQYDIDLYTPKERACAARDAVMALGFEPLQSMERLPTDHLPALIRKTGWEWRGDFFDPEIPIAVEIHFQFWNERMERLHAPGVEEFWPRRVRREVAGVQMDALSRVDALGFASLHLLKHVAQGSARPFHIYEVAHFLEAHADTEAYPDSAAFWTEWRARHSPELRRLEAAMFRLAREWFGCHAGSVAEEEMERLPAATQRWFEEFAASPAQRIFQPAKHELWLHLSLLDSPWDALAVARRRLLPISLPGPVDAIHIPEGELTWRRRLLSRARYLRHVSQRVGHHAQSFPGVFWSGVNWWWKPRALGGQFWAFLGAAVLYNFALFVFVLLYNLRLLELGYREDFLGIVSGAGTLGCVAGTIPAAALARRFGLRHALLATIAASACIAALRALATGRAALAALAFLSGVAFSGWAVAMAPAVAGAVEEKQRPAAFSFFYATMFATGIAGGFAGGRLPLWMHGKQPALLMAAALAALALWPASRLRLAAGLDRRARRKRLDRRRKAIVCPTFMLRYLIPFAIWNLATGSFNPFFNTYFARLGYGAARIGAAFSTAQLAQIAAVLLAPLVFRKAGLVNGIAWMMAATAGALALLAARPAGATAAYAGYMAFQWMSEPGLSTLLMSGVEERERSGAAAANYLVMFGAQALAALVGGAVVSSFGYGVALAGSAALVVLAAGLFRGLLRAWDGRRGFPEPITNSAQDPARTL
ncbi:MAG: MFS transporter [Bryobacteraceae bacterium]|jgi:predicted MFS family arabinose efflux permease